MSTAAALLGVREKALEDMLTLKVVPVTRGEVFTKHLGIKEAVRARDAAIKSLYEAMFLWVVRAINLSLGGAKVAGDDKQPFIGLLDIFGANFLGLFCVCVGLRRFRCCLCWLSLLSVCAFFGRRCVDFAEYVFGQRQPEGCCVVTTEYLYERVSQVFIGLRNILCLLFWLSHPPTM